jgi:hypothetical protein
VAVAVALVDALTPTCTCPDFELRRDKCKHIYAVEFVRTVQTAPDGSQTVTESIKVTRKTYPQDWPRYNAAQCAEKDMMQKLLRGLCDGVTTPAHPGRGPKPIAYSDAIFGMVMKVYTGMSARRASTDIEACAASGHMVRVPHYNSVLSYFDKPELSQILVGLIEQSAVPLADIETSCAIDSTGFGTASTAAGSTPNMAAR